MLTVSFTNLLMYLYFIFVLKTVSPFRSIKTLSEKQTLSLTNLSRYSISVTVVVTGMYIRFVHPKTANTIKNKIILFIQLYLIQQSWLNSNQHGYSGNLSIVPSCLYIYSMHIIPSQLLASTTDGDTPSLPPPDCFYFIHSYIGFYPLFCTMYTVAVVNNIKVFFHLYSVFASKLGQSFSAKSRCPYTSAP